MLIPVEQLEKVESKLSKTGSAVAPLHPDKPVEIAIVEETVLSPKGNMLSPEENLRKRKEMLSSVSPEPVDFAFERAIGRNDSVYSNFIELMMDAKQKVGRIVVKQGNDRLGYATGFLVSENLLLTNWHVFKKEADAADSEVIFNYEYDALGSPRTDTMIFTFQPSAFFHANEQLDYCLVAVSPTDSTGNRRLSDIGYLYLDPTLGKLANKDQESLNIIHHPNGDYKQLSIRENLFVNITPTSIWYKTDTAPGSSGSPVMNDQWQVVALHHMGIAKKNNSGDYIDKDGQVIPRTGNRIDESRVVWIANEGTRISVILTDIHKRFSAHPLVEKLKIKPATVKKSNRHNAAALSTETNQPVSTQMETNSPTQQVAVSVPASILEKNGTVSIQVSVGNTPPPLHSYTTNAPVIDPGLLEIKKLEEEADFSGCKGYQSKFLGQSLDIPLPKPNKKLMKFIARLNNSDAYTLRYYHYSTIFHSVRMMPVISAINVEGNSEKRLDDSPRGTDKWLRDTRLGFDIQLDDAYYKRSGFDRGHMSRREDANWGNTAAEARRNADFTCMYTNACPQVAKLNQSKEQGLWGKIELLILEKGATVEHGKLSRISVFNGPIFKEDDPVFRGIQIPMEFYKIVLWLSDNQSLKATAFRLSQVNLVGDIDFEAIDLDENTEFKPYQCSIKYLHKKTGLDFSHLFQYDTFKGSEDDGFEMASANEVRLIVEEASK